MHSLKKVILLTIIFILVAAIVLPATVSLLENFNISSQNIFNFLSAITDSMIVKASDTDYEYSGNLGIWEEKNSLYIYSGGNSKILQYSIDGSDFSDFEYTDSHSKGSSKTDYIEINNEVKTVVVRDKEKK